MPFAHRPVYFVISVAITVPHSEYTGWSADDAARRPQVHDIRFENLHAHGAGLALWPPRRVVGVAFCMLLILVLPR